MLRKEGYDVTVEASTKSTSNAQIIRINNSGNGKNISQVQVSPGGGRHGTNGGHKAKVFDSALGYNQTNSDHLINQIKSKLPSSEAIMGVKDQYGQRFTVDMTVIGTNGKSAIVRTGWIYDTGSEVPRLTTLYVK